MGDDRIERALDDLCRLDDEFGLTPEDVRWVRERAQTIRAALAAAGAGVEADEPSTLRSHIEALAAEWERAVVDRKENHPQHEDQFIAGQCQAFGQSDRVHAEALRYALAAPDAPQSVGAGAEVDREALINSISEDAAVERAWMDEDNLAMTGRVVDLVLAAQEDVTPTEPSDAEIVEVANRAQEATGRSLWPSTVRAVLAAWREVEGGGQRG